MDCNKRFQWLDFLRRRSKKYLGPFSITLAYNLSNRDAVS
jgi:hypothetical protein